MRKITALALCCLMVAGVFAGCRRNPVTETTTPTSMTNPATTNTTQATRPTSRPTETTRDTQATELPTESTKLPGTTGSTAGNDAGRTQNMPPRY